MADLLSKIHQDGYWRTLIRPTEFKANRIPTLGRCKEIVQKSVVSLRGWDYPFYQENKLELGQDWIASSCDWEQGKHFEYWRFYQSGQFIHQFNFWEEADPLSRVPAPSKYLLVLNTLFTITEIFEFGARLARQEVLGSQAEFIIELHGLKGRELTYENRIGPILFGGGNKFISTQDVLEFKIQVAVNHLLGSPRALALDSAVSIFDHFGWFNPPRDMLAQEQAKFLERRLGV
jgi:hypothetical protein